MSKTHLQTRLTGKILILNHDFSATGVAGGTAFILPDVFTLSNACCKQCNIRKYKKLIT